MKVKKQSYNFTRKEAKEHISKVLKIKDHCNDEDEFRVKHHNNMKRIHKWLLKDLIISKYPNTGVELIEGSGHYWIDVWVGERLLTVRCSK